jgi:hypothetical protein
MNQAPILIEDLHPKRAGRPLETVHPFGNYLRPGIKKLNAEIHLRLLSRLSAQTMAHLDFPRKRKFPALRM